MITQCPACGRWIMSDRGFNILSLEQKDKCKSYLFYHKREKGDYFIGEENKYKDYISSIKSITDTKHLSLDTINAWYPKTFVDKVDLILLKLAELSNFDGDLVNYANFGDNLFFIKSIKSSNIKEGYDIKVQYRYIINFLSKNKFCSFVDSGFLQLLPDAYEKIYELQKNQSNNKNVFVSMAFNPDTKDTREAIRQGIISAGYSPEFIDEIIHNHQIIPEMLRLIGESKFLILEITEPNFGAYYEAGYAAGLGKEIIVCCKELVFNQKDFSCPNLKEIKEDSQEDIEKNGCKIYAKAMRPHFDIAQKQILVWSDYDDLTKKLTEWIKYLFPTP